MVELEAQRDEVTCWAGSFYWEEGDPRFAPRWSGFSVFSPLWRGSIHGAKEAGKGVVVLGHHCSCWLFILHSLDIVQSQVQGLWKGKAKENQIKFSREEKTFRNNNMRKTD